MSDFEDKLNSILSSPSEMEKIVNLARSISNSSEIKDEGAANNNKKSDNGNPDEASFPFGNMDPRIFRIMTKIMSAYSTSDSSDKNQLIGALKPYLKKDRQQQIDRAVEIAKLAHLAKIALSEFSGGDDDL